LQLHKIAGAGLDTMAIDGKEYSPLLKLDNIVLSPHSAFFTNESLDKCADIIVANVKSFVEGKAVNVVN
jgi:D-3-phosphoglycerate dehydrogenase